MPNVEGLASIEEILGQLSSTAFSLGCALSSTWSWLLRLQTRVCAVLFAGSLAAPFVPCASLRPSDSDQALKGVQPQQPCNVEIIVMQNVNTRLRSLSNNADSNDVLFVHPVSGYGRCYEPFQYYLDGVANVHILDATNNWCGCKLSGGVSELAEYYGELLLDSLGRMPKYIAGWSAGAILGYCIAREWKFEHDMSVFLLDPWLEEAADEAYVPEMVSQKKEFWTYIGDVLGDDETNGFGLAQRIMRLQGQDDDVVFRSAFRMIKDARCGVFPPYDDPRHFPFHAKFVYDLYQMCRRFRPDGQNLKGVLFVANDTPNSSVETWVASEPRLSVESLLRSHSDLLKDDGVEGIAKIMRRRMLCFEPVL